MRDFIQQQELQQELELDATGHEVGTKLGPSRDQAGTKLALSWNQKGTQLSPLN